MNLIQFQKPECKFIWMFIMYYFFHFLQIRPSVCTPSAEWINVGLNESTCCKEWSDASLHNAKLVCISCGCTRVAQWVGWYRIPLAGPSRGSFWGIWGRELTGENHLIWINYLTAPTKYSFCAHAHTHTFPISLPVPECVLCMHFTHVIAWTGPVLEPCCVVCLVWRQQKWTHQFLDAVVCENQFCQTRQTLLQVFTYTAEEHLRGLQVCNFKQRETKWHLQQQVNHNSQLKLTKSCCCSLVKFWVVSAEGSHPVF